MADINVTINGVATTITDDGDSTYSIDLAASQTRQFLRAERDELKVLKTQRQDDRDRAAADRDKRIAQRDSAIVARDAANAELAVITARIEEIRTFLQTVGDDPDA